MIAETGTDNSCSLRSSDHISNMRASICKRCSAPRTTAVRYTSYKFLPALAILVRCRQKNKNPCFRQNLLLAKTGIQQAEGALGYFSRFMVKRGAIGPIRNTHRNSLKNTNKRNHIRLFTRKYSSNINA